MFGSSVSSQFKKLFVVVSILCSSLPYIQAQSFQRFDYLPVTQNGTYLRNPWTGGVNSVQFGKVDINHDGKKDLLVFDKNNNKFLPFISQGNNTDNYVFDNHYAACFPQVNGWIILKDYNCDGIEDIFTYNSVANLMVYTGFYRNDTLNYKLQQNGFFYQGVSGTINVYCSDVIKPAIADVNRDGDLDIISFNVFGNRLIYYENQQKELGLSCDSLFFSKADNCWGNVRDSFAASYALRDTCSFKFNRMSGTEIIEHTGSCIEAVDIEGNGTTDLLIGSVSLDNLTLLYNYGTKNYASILNQDVNYPSYSTSYSTSSFGVPAFLDIDNDANTDLLVSSFDAGAANINNIWYYRNIQQNGARKIKLDFVQKDFLLDNMIDAGENSNPCFMDVDGDGLTDILLGSGGFKDNINPAVYKLLFYKNTGTAVQPAYSLQNDDFLNISSLGVKDIVPAAGDIDNDSDTDLLLGISDGRILYWENTAVPGNPPNLIYKGLLKDANGSTISIGSNATPCLADLDRDGKTDLLIGERNGNLNFYKGNALNAVQLSFVTDSLGKVRIKPNNLAIGYTQPTVGDINRDGKYDLLLGTNTYGLQFYSNIEDHLSDSFALSAPLINTADNRTTSTVADINNDGKAELLTGNINGGLVIYSENPPPFVPTYLHNSIVPLDFELFPNPVNHTMNIYLREHNKDIQIQLLNIVGQEVLKKDYSAQDPIELDLSACSNGLYLLRITDGQKEGVQKVVVQH